MLYIGMDVHSKWSCIRGFNPETGEIISYPKVQNNPESIREVIGRLEGPLYGAMEIGTNAWAMYRTLLPFFEQLVVVDTLETWGKEGRRGAKTDRRDAIKLAEKLYRGQLKALYVPDEIAQDFRCLVRGRINATRRITRSVNEIGSILRSWGVVVECSLLTEKIERLAAEDETCRLLMTIPGVGAITAFAVRAEVGDIRRFPSAKHLVSYCGLGPEVSRSSDHVQYRGLPRMCSKVLRYLLVLRGSGLANTKSDNPLRRAYIRVALRGHVNHGKVSAARKLVRIMFAMMKYQEPWDPARAAAGSA